MYTAIPAQRRRGFERGAFDFVMIFVALLFLTAVSLIFFWQLWHLNRIYSGVRIADEPVGGLTRVAALRQLHISAVDYSLPPVTLNDGRQRWPLDLSQLIAEVDWSAAVNQAYLVGRQGDWRQRLFEQVQTALHGTMLEPRLRFDEGRLQTALDRVAQAVRQPAQAGVQSGARQFEAQQGIEVDQSATLRRLTAALQEMRADRPMDLPLSIVNLSPDSEAAPAVNTAAPQAPLPSLRLRDQRFGLDFVIDPVVRRRLLASLDPFTLNERALRALLQTWARQIDVAASDARLYFDPASGVVSVLQSSQTGRKLDIDATYAAIQTALFVGSEEAALTVVDVPPQVDMSRIAEMGIRQLVASGTTYFRGSSAERIHNVKTGAEKFNGVVLPPDGVFSFNNIVEDVSSANGFEDSLVIWGDQTTNGVGGGICQVSTTVFRAAFAAGLPIIERYNHSYVVRWYGEPGFDATIFTPSVDFRFKNDTGAYLLIQPTVDALNGVITFDLYGTKPQRTVTISPAVRSEEASPPPPQYRLDETLPSATIKQVEWETRGVTIEVTRTIEENNVVRTDKLLSKYVPWGAVFLYGPGAQLPPEALITPTPSATPTDATSTEVTSTEATPQPLAP